MSMRYGFFDSEITGYDEDGMPIFDRAESSDFLALFIQKIITDGVLADPSTSFQVIADAGMTVKVKPGFGIVKGRFAYDAQEASYTLEEAPTQYKRIDRVVLRANYLERRCEIIVKTGTAASSPVAPALIRPASGDYFELSLATIAINSNQTAIVQSNITDTRWDSSVCGAVTQAIDHLDTEAFYTQLNAFYAEFVSMSNASYAQFENMAQTAYENFTQAIDDYEEDLEARGEAQLTAITNSLAEFQRTSQNAFNAWFASVQDLLDEDVAGHLINIANDHEQRLTLAEYMAIHNDYFAPLKDDEGYTIVDDEGNAIMVDWKYNYA